MRAAQYCTRVVAPPSRSHSGNALMRPLHTARANVRGAGTGRRRGDGEAARGVATRYDNDREATSTSRGVVEVAFRSSRPGGRGGAQSAVLAGMAANWAES